MMTALIFCFVLCHFLDLSLARSTGSGVIRYNITKNMMDEQWVTTNIYTVYPHGSRYPLQQQHWPSDYRHEFYYAKNVGRGTLHAYARRGDLYRWIEVTSSGNIQPGDMIRLDPSQKSFFTELVVSNYGPIKGYVQCFYESGYSRAKKHKISWNFDLDTNMLVKKLVVFSSDYIPVVGPYISNVLDFFWPATAVDAWEEIKNKVTILIDSAISDLIEDILNNKIRMFKKRIQTIAEEQAVGIRKLRIGDHYLNIAQDMIGLEEEFIFHRSSSYDSLKMNYATLPLFSLVVSMKVLFYRCGFENPDALGLDEHDIQELKIYTSGTLDPQKGIVQKHFKKISQQKMDYVYNNADPENFFNEMANVVNYINFNGEQYLAVWNDMVNGSPAKGKPNNPVLTYPTPIGVKTADLLSLGARLPVFRTLTPTLKADGKRARIVTIHGHTYMSNAVGIDVIYDDKSIISTGLLKGTQVNKFTIEPHYIVKLDVWGDFPDGIIRGLKIITDGNTTYQFGKTTNTIYTFEMKGHHIAGIHMSNDMALKKSKAWNVAVSFQPDNIFHE